MGDLQSGWRCRRSSELPGHRRKVLALAVVVWLLLVAGCGAKSGLDVPELGLTGEEPNEAVVDAGPLPRFEDPCLEGRRPWLGLSAGADHTCATGSDGQLYCWGGNYSDQLGLGLSTSVIAAERDLEPHPTPELVPGEWEAPITWHDAGMADTCAVTETGEVWCWGGYGIWEEPSVTSGTPVQLPEVTDAAEVASEDGTTCARTCGGDVWCWGNNFHGSVGTGSLELTSGPQRVEDLAPVDGITVAGTSSCARVRADGTIWCWGRVLGSDYDPSLPEGYPHHLRPTLVPGLTDVVSFRGGLLSVCAVQRDHRAFCWGWDPGEGVAPIQMDLSGVADIHPGTNTHHLGMARHHCALHETGRVSCWGDNPFGQLGNGTTRSSDTPVEVAGLSDAVAIAVGWNHACARRRGGQVVCWGGNHHGQLGDGTTTDRSVPTPVLLP